MSATRKQPTSPPINGAAGLSPERAAWRAQHLPGWEKLGYVVSELSGPKGAVTWDQNGDPCAPFTVEELSTLRWVGKQGGERLHALAELLGVFREKLASTKKGGELKSDHERSMDAYLCRDLMPALDALVEDITDDMRAIGEMLPEIPAGY